jgi:uncharacterized membrane protein HdeD (DUF308 family)
LAIKKRRRVFGGGYHRHSDTGDGIWRQFTAHGNEHCGVEVQTPGLVDPGCGPVIEIQLRRIPMANTRAQTRPGFPLTGPELLSSLADNWWLLLLRGIAAIAFGILAFFWPGLTLLTLTLLWGAYALCDGIFAIWAAIVARAGDMGPRWWLALAGIVSILAGLVAFFYPVTTALVLLTLIAVWAIIIGVLQIWGAIEWRNILDDAWLLVLNGALSIAFGAILLARPGAGALALVWMIGWFAVVFGCLNVALAFRLKRFKQLASLRSGRT